MKLARLADTDGGEILAVLLNRAEGTKLVDLGLATQSCPFGQKFRTMDELITGGDKGMAWLHDAVGWIAERMDPAWAIAPADARWCTPVAPRPVIAAGRNFRSHREEGRNSVHTPPQAHGEFPTGFVKLPQSLVPHGAAISVPPEVTQLDHEVEVAVVVGKPLSRASPEQAGKSIFGYTIFNDLSARDWQMRERKNGLLLVGKNFPGAGPIGPFILTADEVPNPAALTLTLHVNGDLRQHGTCADLLFPIEELVSFWSRMGLAPCDIIATGTPEGVAMHRKPDPGPYFLKPGDRVCAAVQQIGELEVTIESHKEH